MNVISRLMRRFAASDSGATAIEYGLIASLIVVVIIATIQQISGSMIAMYNLIVSVM